MYFYYSSYFSNSVLLVCLSLFLSPYQNYTFLRIKKRKGERKSIKCLRSKDRILESKEGNVSTGCFHQDMALWRIPLIVFKVSWHIMLAQEGAGDYYSSNSTLAFPSIFSNLLFNLYYIYYLCTFGRQFNNCYFTSGDYCKDQMSMNVYCNF